MSIRRSWSGSLQHLVFRPTVLAASLVAACGPAPRTDATEGAGTAGSARSGSGPRAGAAGETAAAVTGGAAGSSAAGNGGRAAGGSAGIASSGTGSAAAGSAAAGGSQNLGGGGAIAGSGGATSGGGGETSGGGGMAGAPMAGIGAAAGAGGAPLGGSTGSAGSPTGGAGNAGSAATGPFVCNQLTGSKLSYEWFIAGFEDVVDDSRWQVKWKEDAYLEEWANPQSSFWSAGIESLCASGTTAPDRIVFGVVSWKYTTQAEWRTAVTQTVNTIQAKYPSMRRLDLVTQIRGPNNMLCPTAPTAGETISVPPELDAALEEVAAAFPGFVFVGPKSVADSCSQFQGGGPHLTEAGNRANVEPFATYFAQTQ